VTVAGIALVASALATPPAEASFGLPVLGRCVRVPGAGLYKYPRCVGAISDSRQGNYEFLEGVGARPGFSAHVAEVILQTTSGAKVTCGASELDGEWNGRPTEKPDISEPPAAVSFALHGCGNASSGASCQTSEAARGEITSPQPLVGNFGFISAIGEPLKAGLDLSPGGPSPIVLGFTCGGPPEAGGESWMLEGSVIGRIKPLDTMTSTYKLIFAARGAEQVPERLQGGPADALRATRVSGSGTSEEAVGLTLRDEHRTIEARGEEALEIKAKN
jgi:hypothetical protein